MPAVNQLARVATAFTLVCVPLLTAQAAYAGGRGDDGTAGQTQETGNASDDGTLSSKVGVIVYDRSKNGSGSSVGPVTSTTPWTPPACWYAPKYSPAQLKAYLEPIWEAGSTGDQWDSQQRDRYVNGHPYKDFNQDKDGKGYWWDSYVNESFPPGWDKCTEPIFWVDKGDPPPANVQNAVTPKILAELAYNEIRVPSTKVTLAPANATKVNLPTWAWLDGAQFKPVSVTASVPVLGISATTTAEPVSLKIDPGTSDAETYPATGVCQINGGHIGEPYAKGKANQTPPCGVKYLRSSGNGTYPLKATITWKIHWTGSDGTGDNLPDGTFGATQNVTVQEIQAVNR
ncbi:hypothetical protein [Streptomyces griseorubiginosus]|uniref:hypothetical protein n=1 Tax=Streptomyces griseorubiginosus TaxID=67304 RepID=UPI001AD7C5F5|nr:hypothetical protein [Streptomyces griseorubiginosus]MBO4258011.1 hypothetical protein [Streptomyces griseorubiginosus]